MASTGPLLFNFALVNEDSVLAALGQLTQAVNVLAGRVDAVAQAVQANTTLDIFTTEAIMSASSEIADTRDKVAAQTTVIASAVTLLQGNSATLAAIRAELAARGVSEEDLAVLDEAQATLDANTQTLAEAVEENTPVVPEPEAEV